jgi:hypothetical protein
MDLVLTPPNPGPRVTIRALERAARHVDARHKVCDVRCIMAVSDDCSCACGGRNHGIGLRVSAGRGLDLEGKL